MPFRSNNPLTRDELLSRFFPQFHPVTTFNSGLSGGSFLIEHQGQRFVERFDANSYLYITKAMDYFCPEKRFGGDLSKAFAASKAAFLVVSFSSDWLFTTRESRAIVKALLKNRLEVSFCEIKSSYGHDAFLLETEVLGKMISDFLRNQWEKRYGQKK